MGLIPRLRPSRGALRALTLWPEWAWAVCHLGKNVENRSWPIPRGMVGETIAIHAGARFGGREIPPAHAAGEIGAVAFAAGWDSRSDSEWRRKFYRWNAPGEGARECTLLCRCRIASEAVAKFHEIKYALVMCTSQERRSAVPLSVEPDSLLAQI